MQKAGAVVMSRWRRGVATAHVYTEQPRLPHQEVAKAQIDGTKARTLLMIDTRVGADK